jgi:putative polyhydroxyalkanoate system protein
MAIHLERTHHLDKAAAREQVAEVVEEIAPLIKAKYHWEGDRLTFRGRGVRGAIEVDDEAVRVEVVRSPLLPVSERWLRARIEERLEAHFPEPTRAPEAVPPSDATPSPPAPEPAGEAETARTHGTPTPPRDAPVTKLISPLTDLAGEAAHNALRIASLASKASFHIAREILRTDDEPGPEDPKT